MTFSGAWLEGFYDGVFRKDINSVYAKDSDAHKEYLKGYIHGKTK